MEEEAALDGLANLIHLLQTYFLLLLVQTVFIQVFNQVSSQGDVLSDFFIIFLTLISQANLVWHTYPLEILDEFGEIYATSDEIALGVKCS